MIVSDRISCLSMLLKIKGMLPLAWKVLFVAGLFIGLVALLLQVTVPLAASALAAGLAAAAGLALTQLAPARVMEHGTTPPGGIVEEMETSPPAEEAQEVQRTMQKRLDDATSQVQALTRNLEQSRAQIWQLNAQRDDISRRLEQAAKSLEEISRKDLVDLEVLLRLGYHDAVDQLKRELLIRAIQEADGNRAEAARRLGLQRTYLYRLIKQLDVEP
jgi:transcriptional regulator with GAF, ATPase, and Fis domain